ncbi:Hypothetical protein D9617_4g000850 [Elsinoe fawcettii]|nr:Hypothetical protein D9617_4g000850 [Elsinoe fawcettii]
MSQNDHKYCFRAFKHQSSIPSRYNPQHLPHHLPPTARSTQSTRPTPTTTMYWPTSLLPDRSFAFLQRSLGLSSQRHNKATSPDAPTPYTMKKDILFVAIDIEAWEHDQSQITEVGIATLDTRHLVSSSPGRDGEGWLDAISARHLRDKDLLHRVNKRYVKGCPEAFRFGTTELMGREEMKRTLRQMVRFGPGGPGEGKRRVVVVVHDRAAEERLLDRFDGKVFKGARVVYTADTQVLADKEGRKRGLGKVLEVLDLEGEDVHNAGNDAVYTLQAMVRMVCLKTFAMRELKERLAQLG